MTQQQNPTPVPPSPPPEPPKTTTSLGNSTRILVMNLLDFVDQVFFGLMGDLGRTVYASIQDAIALSILLQIPSNIAKVIISKDFSSYDVCLQENPLGASCLACFIIVTSDFLLWIVLGARIGVRFWVDMKNLNNS